MNKEYTEAMESFQAIKYGLKLDDVYKHDLRRASDDILDLAMKTDKALGGSALWDFQSEYRFKNGAGVYDAYGIVEVLAADLTDGGYTLKEVYDNIFRGIDADNTLFTIPWESDRPEPATAYVEGLVDGIIAVLEREYGAKE